MKQIMTISLALLLAVSMTAMPLAAATAGTTVSIQDDDREDIAPGEQLTGVVGVQEAELNGELAERTYGVKIANAQTDDAKADVVGEQLTDIEDRINTLENRTEGLNEAREAGEISRGQYEAEMAAVAVERTTAERLANGTTATTSELNEELLEERGINVEAIHTLADRASELGGPEVATIAQSIAGEQAGQPTDADREPGAPIELPDTGHGNPADDAGDRGGPETDEDERDTPESGENGTDGRDTPDVGENGADERDASDGNQNDVDERDASGGNEDSSDASEIDKDDESGSDNDRTQDETGNQ